jgi:hypothetical protein
MSAVHWSAPLHRIAKAVAVAASEEPPGIVELRNLPAAIYSVGTDTAYKPGPFSAEAARCPTDRYALTDGLPIVPACSVGEAHKNNLISAMRSTQQSHIFPGAGMVSIAN